MKSFAEIYTNNYSQAIKSTISELEEFVVDLCSDFLSISYSPLKEPSEIITINPFDSGEVEILKKSISDYTTELWLQNNYRYGLKIDFLYNETTKRIEAAIGK